MDRMEKENPAKFEKWLDTDGTEIASFFCITPYRAGKEVIV